MPITQTCDNNCYVNLIPFINAGVGGHAFNVMVLPGMQEGGREGRRKGRKEGGRKKGRRTSREDAEEGRGVMRGITGIYFNIIKGTSFTNVLANLTATYPSIRFLASASYRPPSWPANDNLAVFFPWYEQGTLPPSAYMSIVINFILPSSSARYLTGYAAGLLTQTNRICYVS